MIRAGLTLPVEQAEPLFTELKVLGREVELIRFEGEPHGLSRGGRPKNRAEGVRSAFAHGYSALLIQGGPTKMEIGGLLIGAGDGQQLRLAV